MVVLPLHVLSVAKAGVRVSLDMTLARTGMGYIFTVSDPPDELLRFEIGHMVKHAWGIRGRVTVRSKMQGVRAVPGMSGYLTTETLDFLNGKSRQFLAERLGQLIPAPPGGAAFDWSLIVEQMVAQIMDLENRPPVVVPIETVPVVTVQPHVIPYLLPENKTTILYGAGGTGKSKVAASVAAAVQTGTKWLGNPVKRMNVLYCDWETDEGDIAHRIAAASRGIGLTSTAPVKYMTLDLPLDNEIDYIARAVVENNIGFVIVDSVMMAMSPSGQGADPAASAIQFFRALRMLNCTVLCIDHISGEDQKKGRAGTSKPYGSIAKYNTVRNGWELVDATDEMDGSRLIMRHRKANLGPKVPGGEVHLKVEWNEITDVLTLRRIVVTEPDVSLGERITEALETGPAGYKTLLDVLNSDQRFDWVDEAQLRGASRALLSGGIATIDNNGVLRLTKKDDPPDVVADPPSLPLDLVDEETVDS